MQFEKAYNALLKGKRIRRKAWEHMMHMKIVGDEVKTYRGDYTQFYNKADIVISNGWIVLDGDGKELPFLEALEELKNKKKITKKEWIDKGLDKFIFVDNNQLAMCTAMECDFMPTYACLIAIDWEIMP